MHPFTTTIIILCNVFLFMSIVSSQSQQRISLSQKHGGHHASNEGHHHQGNTGNVHDLTALKNRPITTIQYQIQNRINHNTPPSNPNRNQNRNQNQNEVSPLTLSSNPNQNQHQNQINPLTPSSNPNQNQNQNQKQIKTNPLTPPSNQNQNNQIKTNPLSPPSNPNQNQNQIQMQDQENNTNPGRLFGWAPNNNTTDNRILLADEFLYAHNWVRRKYNLPPFTWDQNLEKYARKYLMERYNDCLMIHSNGSYGENLFWGKQLHWTPSDAVYFWYMEKDLYDFKTLKCIPRPPESAQSDAPKTCGHFTQIVWRDSTRLGCALQDCNDRSVGMLIACEYDPPGNYDNENPLEHYS